MGGLGDVPDFPAVRTLTTERGGVLSPREPQRTVDPLGEPLARALDGDEEAFGEVWRLLHPPLLRYLRVRDRDTAEDIAAETWLHVVRDLARFAGGPAEFRAWVFTLGRHRAIDAGRARAARPSTPTAEIIDIGTAPSAEAAALERVDTDAAVRLVATLPPPQAEMVMLRVVAGLSVAEVAAIVDKKPGTVAVNVHRALKKLARTHRARRGEGVNTR
ncbi:RNA polymerase sigma factor [Nocardioides sp. L-11A]|uniref:RNA polymerase sigma factor n=1 Tax=Nocardioides sp. L-11A TaxID=3043848 RepID=UPI00249AA928|nr:sigma-70 family RNA polymerase sigma factor [Nocardioides sp. L-11A]